MRSQQSGRSTPDLHSVEGDSDQREHEEWGQNERISGGGQGGGAADDLVQSGGSRGKSWSSGYTIVRVDHY